MKAARTIACWAAIALTLTACSPNYSQVAADFVTGVSAVRAYSDTLSQSVSADQEAFDSIERNIHMMPEISRLQVPQS
jgi:hypothetical protein